jgi:hypothetical protein
MEPSPPQAEDACMINGKHWLAHDKIRSRFWARINELGLSNEETHQALGVESAYDFRGSMQQALDTILAWIDARIGTTPESEVQAAYEGDPESAPGFPGWGDHPTPIDPSMFDEDEGLPEGPPGLWQHGEDE